MAFEGLRSKLRDLADSGSEAADRTAERARREAPERAREAAEGGRRAARGVAKRAPSTGLERGQQPTAPAGSRKAIMQRLNQSGQMHKPIPDANLEPGADPRWMESFARGDSTVDGYFDGAGESGDEADRYFGSTESTDFWNVSDYQQELQDERDHEGGLYAFEDDREEGWLDDGVPMGDIMAESPSDRGMRWF